MMKLSEDVLLDLLPLYLAGEARQGTRDLVEQHLDTDPNLARIAKEMRESRLPDLPLAAPPDQELKALARTRHLILQRSLFLMLAVAFTIFFAVSMGFLLESHPEAGAISFTLTVIFWIVYWIHGWRISRL